MTASLRPALKYQSEISSAPPIRGFVSGALDIDAAPPKRRPKEQKARHQSRQGSKPFQIPLLDIRLTKWIVVAKH
jgi:hypothetical protein